MKVLREFRTQPSFPQVCPEPINVRNVEDQPLPPGNRITKLQIENRVLSVLSAERREIRVFAPVNELQAQKISIEPQRGRHAGDLSVTAEIFSTVNMCLPLLFAKTRYVSQHT